MIRSQGTWYDGHLFRSRLEARWAFVFNYMGVPYQYEPEQFTLPDGRGYIPDFFLPAAGTWIEIKGDAIPAEISDKAHGLYLLTGQPVYLIGGSPRVGTFLDLFDPQSGFSHEVTGCVLLRMSTDGAAHASAGSFALSLAVVLGLIHRGSTMWEVRATIARMATAVMNARQYLFTSLPYSDQLRRHMEAGSGRE
jgi:hypothetical protein